MFRKPGNRLFILSFNPEFDNRFGAGFSRNQIAVFAQSFLCVI